MSTYNLGFVGNIQFGSSAQVMPILFDGGANSNQVTGAGCNCNNPTTLPFFNGANSSTFVSSSKSSSVEYGGESSSSATTLVNDNVAIVSDGSTPNAVLTNFQFEYMTSGSQLPGVSGDFGFGYKSVILSTLVKAGQIPLEQWSLTFNSVTGSGYFSLGGKDPSLPTSTTYYSLPIFNQQDSAWNYSVYAVNGINANNFTTTGEKFHFDCGAGVTELPSYYQTQAFYNALAGSNGASCTFGTTYVQCTCSSISQLNNLEMTIKTSSGLIGFVIPPSGYVTSVKNGTCHTMIKFVTSTGLTPRLSANWQQYFYMNYDQTGNAINIAANLSAAPTGSAAAGSSWINTTPATGTSLSSYVW